MTRMIKFSKIIVYMHSMGTDRIIFFTERPSAFSKEVVGDEPLILSAEAPRLTGAHYIQKTFGFAPDVVDTRSLDERKREDEERGKQSNTDS